MAPRKLRAWDTTQKSMVNPSSLKLCLNDDGELRVLCGPAGETWDESFEDRELIPLWSTGLTDKIGVEIFENDLVTFAGATWLVGWYAMGAQYTLFTTHDTATERYTASAGVPIRDFNFLDGGKQGYLHKERLTDDVVVIGNIYQNPELLK